MTIERTDYFVSLMIWIALACIAGCQASSRSPIGIADATMGDDTQFVEHDPALDKPERNSDLTLVSHAQTYIVSVWMDQTPLPTNELIELFASVRSPDGHVATQADALAFDAEMQHHRHGLIQQPIVTPLGDGFYHISNILLHMPGRWELYFDITLAGVMERTQWTVTLE